MKHKFFSFLLTALLGVFGMNAWAQDYEISSAQDLADFASAVNGGEFEANAILTADIDMADLDSWTAIGDWGGISGTASACFKGHFDGQGHTITNFNFTSTHNYYGIFGVVAEGGVVENFTIYGDMQLAHKTGGVVGYTRDTSTTVRNIQSYLNLTCTGATSAPRPGGIVGTAVNGTTNVVNCAYSGTIDVNGNTGNIGGIVGYVNNNAAAIVNITNCLFDGTITNNTTADGQCGGIVGYNNSGTVTIKNCLSIGSITAKSDDIGMFFGRLNGSNSIFDNNYYVGDYINGTGSGKSASGPAPVKVTKTQLRNGETCYKLNGDQSTINWFQELKNMAFIAEKYVTTVDGADRAEQSADIKLVENDEGTFDFTLPNFVVSTNYFTFQVGDISLQDITITSAGTFSKGGTFSVPDENIPSQLITMGVSTDKFKDVPYTLNGKVNGEKLYATINDITFDLGAMLGGERHVSVEVGTDDFEAKAPTGDDYPTPFGTDIVYANGTFNCDLTPKDGSEVTYSNTDASFIAAHIFADGFCTVCGAFDANYMTANADGKFEIGTPAQLKWFAVYVNQVNPAVDAILTANIDLSSVEWTPIGKGVYYGGTFDGQGFTVSNLTYVGSGDCNGLFGGVKDATVKNFSINGSLVCAGSWTGAIGRAENATISNVHSALTIETPATGVFHHAGGVVGGSYNPTTVDRCSFSGTLTVNAESHDCFAGIMGYTTDNCTVKNCINYGTISFAKNNCYAGGIIGYINSAACNGTHNCLNIGTVEYTGEGDPSYSGAIVGRLRGNNPALWGYSYYLAGSAVNANGENQIPTNYEVTAAQLANGEAAAKLAPYIRQNIGTDATPVLDPTHNVVAEITAAGYATLYVPDANVTIPTGVEAYTGEFATNPNNGIQHLALNEVGSIIPAQTAVVLKGAEGIYEFAISVPVPDGALGVYDDEVDGNEALVKGWAAPFENNVLKGTADDIEAAGKYILAQPAGEPVCFYLAESGIIKAGKAYLEVPEGTDVKAFYFSFGDEDPTGINSLTPALSKGEGAIYNVAGQRVSKMQKGINIVNGKKVLF